MKRYFLMTFVMLFLGSVTVRAQQTSTTTTGVRRGVAVVMFAGLAGAVLGLSTLSFYGEPQEHIGNIWLGMGLGVVGGSAYLFSQKNRNNQNFEVALPTNPHQWARLSHPTFEYEWEF